jgi:hypothetical protein
MRTFLTALVGLVVALPCAAVALLAVLAVDRGFERLTADLGPNARLFFALVAPFGVVLFGLLMERASRLLGRFERPAVA